MVSTFYECDNKGVPFPSHLNLLAPPLLKTVWYMKTQKKVHVVRCQSMILKGTQNNVLFFCDQTGLSSRTIFNICTQNKIQDV